MRKPYMPKSGHPEFNQTDRLTAPAAGELVAHLRRIPKETPSRDLAEGLEKQKTQFLSYTGIQG